MPTTPSFKDMPLWQHSMQLAVEINSLAGQFPVPEQPVIIQNLLDAAIAIPVALARSSKAGKKSFLDACLSSRQTAVEIETLLVLLQQLYSELAVDDILAKTIDLQRGLTVMAQRLNSRPPA